MIYIGNFGSFLRMLGKCIGLVFIVYFNIVKELVGGLGVFDVGGTDVKGFFVVIEYLIVVERFF